MAEEDLMFYDLRLNQEGDSEYSSDDNVGDEIDYPDPSEVFWSDNDDEPDRAHDLGNYIPWYEVTISRHEVATSRSRAYSTIFKPVVYRPTPALKTVAPRDTEKSDCAICLCDNDRDLLFCQNGCGKLFHRKCMMEYTKPHPPTSAKCPLCRTWSKFSRLESK